MAVGATGLDATAYPANNQTMTARVVAQILSDVRMVIPLLLKSNIVWCCS